jgi:single-strand DNA-binding protein
MWHETKVIGNVGRPPEMRYLPSGASVTSFSVAANNSYTSASGEKVKETTWYRVSAFGKLAETVNQYVTKGMLIMVSGRLSPDKETGSPKIWTDNSGNPRTSFDLTAQDVRFLSSRGAVEQDSVDNDYPPEGDPPF